MKHLPCEIADQSGRSGIAAEHLVGRAHQSDRHHDQSSTLQQEPASRRWACVFSQMALADVAGALRESGEAAELFQEQLPIARPPEPFDQGGKVNSDLGQHCWISAVEPGPEHYGPLRAIEYQM